MRTTLRVTNPQARALYVMAEDQLIHGFESTISSATFDATPAQVLQAIERELQPGVLAADAWPWVRTELDAVAAILRSWVATGIHPRVVVENTPDGNTHLVAMLNDIPGVTAEIRDTGLTKTIIVTIATRPGWVLEFSDGEGGLPYTEDGLMVVVELLDRREPDCPDDAVSNASRVLLEASTAGVVMDPPGAEEPDILRHIDGLVRGMAAQDTPTPAAEPQQPEPVQDESVISITVTRSAGKDGAFVIQIDPDETGVLSTEGGPGLRVYLREATIYSDRDLDPYRHDRQTSGRVCASRYLDVTASEVDYVEGPPRILSRHQTDTGIPCRWSYCNVTPQAVDCPNGCRAGRIHEMS